MTSEVSIYILTNGLNCIITKKSHAACSWRISRSENLEERPSTHACKERTRLLARYVCHDWEWQVHTQSPESMYTQSPESVCSAETCSNMHVLQRHCYCILRHWWVYQTPAILSTRKSHKRRRPHSDALRKGIVTAEFQAISPFILR